MKVNFEWNKPIKQIAQEKTGGKQGMLILANEAKRLMNPYVPADNLVLAQNVQISADEECGHVLYNSPYAHYQWAGEVYGPNYPIKDGGEVAGWYSPPHKTPTGRKLEYSTFRHPLATSHWDEAMKVAWMDDLIRAYENYLKGG